MNTEEMKNQIQLLKKDNNAQIIAHHYAPEEIHSIADVLSDSRGFFEAIQNGINADVLVVVAPKFFAEITAALRPDKTVIVPIESECPVAHHRDLSYEKISTFKKNNLKIPLVCYATSPLNTKLLADVIALPGEVVSTIDNIDSDEILFVGEHNCTYDAIGKSKKKIIPYPKNPVCNVYNVANLSDIQRLKRKYPESCVLVHPECKPEVVNEADYSVGTGDMVKIVKEINYDTYILGTEKGFYDRMKNEYPDKKFVLLNDNLICNVFKVFRIEDIYTSLKKMDNIIKVDKTISDRLGILFSGITEN